MTIILQFLTASFITVYYAVAIRPLQDIPPLEAAYDIRFALRRQPSLTREKEAEKKEVLANIAQVKDDVTALGERIQEEQASVATTAKSLSSDPAPSDAEKAKMEAFVNTEKSTATAASQKELMEESNAAVQSADINSNIAEQLTDESEKESVAAMVAEDDVKAESLLTRAQRLGKEALNVATKADRESQEVAAQNQKD